ncbi:hypothetical protein L1887_54417 [Cichorium endivia]|nr:hypothetical protein L1887_54417 [Cichorium endivia]
MYLCRQTVQKALRHAPDFDGELVQGAGEVQLRSGHLQGVDDGDSILVKERDVCSALGLLSWFWVDSPEDIAVAQRWQKHRWRAMQSGCGLQNAPLIRMYEQDRW